MNLFYQPPDAIEHRSQLAGFVRVQQCRPARSCTVRPASPTAAPRTPLPASMRANAPLHASFIASVHAIIIDPASMKPLMPNTTTNAAPTRLRGLPTSLGAHLGPSPLPTANRAPDRRHSPSS